MQVLQSIEDSFNSVFSEAKESTQFQNGFEDAMAGRAPSSEDDNYINGYSVGYEYGEKQNAG